MKNFMFSEVIESPYGGYEQTIWCVDTTRAVRMWRSDGEAEASYSLCGNHYADGTHADVLTAFVAAWQDAWQHDEDLEAEARLQTERHGFSVSLNAFRRTWGTYWISGDRPAWAV